MICNCNLAPGEVPLMRTSHVTVAGKLYDSVSFLRVYWVIDNKVYFKSLIVGAGIKIIPEVVFKRLIVNLWEQGVENVIHMTKSENSVR